MIVPFEYDTVGDFSDGLSWVSYADANGTTMYGYVDEGGNVIIPVAYDSCGVIFDGPMQTASGRFFYVIKGTNIGVFENSNVADFVVGTQKRIPSHTVLSGGILMVVVMAVVLVLILRKKKSVSTAR